jgi:hypothetical protein
VELEVPDALEQPAERAAQLAMDLSALRDVECESLLVGTSSPDRLVEFRSELTSVGLEIPLSMRVDARAESLAMAVEAISSGASVGRWVVTLEASAEAASIARVYEAARGQGVPIEWEFEAVDHEIPGLVGRVFAGGEGATVAALSLVPAASLHDYRVLASALAEFGAARKPIVLRQRIEADAAKGLGIPGTPESELLDTAVRLGGLLCDGIGDVVSFDSHVGAAAAVDLAYRVLQGARQRTTRTEYISCPSCGRTLFDLEETTARIKARTDHLKGVKIAVMGCIVNGPGEMADADFGYVGSGVGQVTLYVGKQVVERAVPEAEATDRLVELIQEHGQWVESQPDVTDANGR